MNKIIYFFLFLMNVLFVKSIFIKTLVDKDHINVLTNYCPEYKNCLDYKRYKFDEYISQKGCSIPLIHKKYNLTNINNQTIKLIFNDMNNVAFDEITNLINYT